MSHHSSLTRTQTEILMRSPSSHPTAGVVTFEGVGVDIGLRRAAWLRSVGRLEKLGLLRPCPQGGYEVTEDGQAYVDGRARDLASAVS